MTGRSEIPESIASAIRGRLKNAIAMVGNCKRQGEAYIQQGERELALSEKYAHEANGIRALMADLGIEPEP